VCNCRREQHTWSRPSTGVESYALRARPNRVIERFRAELQYDVGAGIGAIVILKLADNREDVSYVTTVANLDRPQDPPDAMPARASFIGYYNNSFRTVIEWEAGGISNVRAVLAHLLAVDPDGAVVHYEWTEVPDCCQCQH
jgi:hypothetical protein